MYGTYAMIYDVVVFYRSKSSYVYYSDQIPSYESSTQGKHILLLWARDKIRENNVAFAVADVRIEYHQLQRALHCQSVRL